MKKTFSNIIGLVCFILPFTVNGQNVFNPDKSSLLKEDSSLVMKTNDDALAKKYPFVRAIFNRIQNSSGLDSFYQKLYDINTSGTGKVSIVHIGDSHIQADLLSGVVRNGLQDFFGNAGRGLVFPYQLAQSNAPGDIGSSSNTKWEFNRIAHPERSAPYGISGYGIRTNNSGANISLFLKSGISYFNKLRFFTDTSSAWILKADTNSVSYELRRPENDSLLYREVTLDWPAFGFSLQSDSSDVTREFYGVSLENSRPGVLYHMIGVNGARYDQYNSASLFWKQLPGLEADLYIISLGTNEAQQASIIQSSFAKELEEFIANLKKASPHASILITTAPDSYRRRRLNPVIKQVNTGLVNFCNKNYIPVWDLYSITNGYGSAYSWAKRGLMSRDRVHFTAEGYRLQGNLLLIALAKGYNAYVSTYK
jgi:lysophospholipase L1-like esterase